LGLVSKRFDRIFFPLVLIFAEGENS